MEELRKIQHLDRLVLVEDRTMSSSAILSLNKPGSDKKMGNPFFPSKVVPVDCLPYSKGYVLLVLLERVSSEDVQKFGIDSKSVAAESELRTKGSASRKPYEKDSRLRLQQGDRRWLPNTPWDRGAFSQQRYDAGAGAVQNSSLRNAASCEHFQTADVLKACVGAVNILTSVASEYELRRQMEEDYRRKMIEEEEHWQWLAKEEERRLMEEMHLRQVQEEDWFRWVHNEERKRIQEEEHRRIEEEEWRRQIEEEQMRQIQEERMKELQEEEEEERMRKIQEEHMREIQEEERMRRIQEERMRQIQEKEEERIRQIQEEERMRRMREIREEKERMRRVQEESVRQIQEERMRRMREIQEEERMRQIQEEQMRQIHEVERVRRIQEEEYRKIEEEVWRRQMQEEQRRIKEEEWRRQIQEDERRKQIQKEEQTRNKEEEWRRKMQKESQKRPVLEEKCSKKVVKEEQLRRPVKEERERELVRGSVIRSRNDLVQDLIANSLGAAAIPQLSADASQKVKHLVAEAIRTVGAMEQGARPGGGQNREVGGISRTDKTVSQFGMFDKEISQSRHLEEEYLRYIREVESAHDHSHDTSGGAVGRYGSEQNDPKAAQHRAVGIKSSDKLPSLLDLKLKHPEFKVDRSYSALHSEDRVGDTNQWQRKVLTVRKEFDSQAERDRQTDRSFNYGNQARDLVRNEKSTFSSVTENITDIYSRRSDLDQEKRRSSAIRGRTDVHGAGNRNVIGRPEHSRKDRHHTVSGRPSTRPWLDSN